jgi:protein phosphatase
MMDDREIMDIVRQYPDDLELTAKTLVVKANENGGKDNISIVIVKL